MGFSCIRKLCVVIKCVFVCFCRERRKYLKTYREKRANKLTKPVSICGWYEPCFA